LCSQAIEIWGRHLPGKSRWQGKQGKLAKLGKFGKFLARQVWQVFKIENKYLFIKKLNQRDCKNASIP
jgi:hypothetical protein